ncbi:MAG: hypothetical protein Q4B94_07340 [Pseudomonadota bacterium]|nr:hypothetical protein [Pseudomonadota bacterium]
MPQLRPEKQFNIFAIVGLIAAVCGLPLEFLPWKPQGWGHVAFVGLFFALLATVSGIAACHLALAEIGSARSSTKAVAWPLPVC